MESLFTRTHSGSQSEIEGLDRDRRYLLIAAVMYTLWGAIQVRSQVPGADHELWGRALVSSWILLVFSASYLPQFSFKHFSKLCHFSIFVLTAHFFFLIYAGGIHPTKAVGAIILVTAAATYFESRATLLTYSIFSVLLSFCLVSSPDAYPKSSFIFGLITALSIFYYGASTRFGLLQREKSATRRLLDVFESMTDGFYLLDKDWNFVYINPEGERLIGRSNEDLAGKNGWEVFPEEADSVIKDNFTLALSENRTKKFQIHVESLKKHFDVRACPSKGGLSVYFHDITEQVESQNSLSKERLLLKEAEEMAKLGNWEINLSTDECTWSDGLFKIYGISPTASHRVHMKTPLERTHPDDLCCMSPSVISAICRLASLGQPKPLSIENRIMMDDGKVKWISTKARPVTNASGELVMIRGVTQDISEKKLAELSLADEQARAMTSAKMAALGEMASGVAHEINNPLAIIHGKAEQLKTTAEDTQIELTRESVVNMAEKIESTALRISKIVKSLRSFARDGSIDPFQKVSIETIMQDTLELCRERFLSQNVQLRSRLNECGTLLLECRPVQVSQVLINLLNNSFDSVCTLKDRWVEVEVLQADGVIEISVSDSGPGVPFEIRDKIFQPFFTTKDVGKGTGLGLSVSKGIVEGHGGVLKLDTSSKFTRIIVLLPQSQSSSINLSNSADKLAA